MPDTLNPTDFERSDASPLLLVALIAGLGLIVIGVMIALAFLFPNAQADRDAMPVRPLPPEPRLQIDPRADLVAYRRGEVRRLESYGWVDRASGRAHVPIEQAMRQVAREGWRGGAG